MYFSDFLIPPALLSFYILINLVLRSFGINNKVVLLSFLFVFSHLFYTVLMYYQLRVSDCQSGSGLEYSTFSAVFNSLITVAGYVILSLLPLIKVLFYPFSLLPYSTIWLDHLIVSLPATGFHMLARYVIRGLIGCL